MDNDEVLLILACFRLPDIGQCVQAVEKLLRDKKWNNDVLLSLNLTKHFSVAVYWIFHMRELIEFSSFLRIVKKDKVLHYITQSDYHAVTSSIRRNVVLYIFQNIYSDSSDNELRRICRDILTLSYLDNDKGHSYVLLTRDQLNTMNYLNTCIACCHTEAYVSSWYEDELLRVCNSNAMVSLCDCLGDNSLVRQVLHVFSSNIQVRVVETLLSDESYTSFDFASLYALSKQRDASLILLISVLTSPVLSSSRDINAATRSVAFAAIVNEKASVLQRCIAFADNVYDARDLKAWMQCLVDLIHAEAAECAYFSFFALTVCELIPQQSLHTLKILCQLLYSHRNKAADAIEMFIHIARNRIRELEQSARDLFSVSEDTSFSLPDVTVERLQHWASTVRKTKNLPVAIVEMCNFMGRNAASSLLLAMKNHIRRDASLRSECADIVTTMRGAKMISSSDANAFLAYATGDVQDHHADTLTRANACLSLHQLETEGGRVTQVIKLLLNVQDMITKSMPMNNKQSNAILSQWRIYVQDCMSSLSLTQQQYFVVAAVITQALLQVVESYLSVSSTNQSSEYHALFQSFMPVFAPTSPFLMVLISAVKVKHINRSGINALAYCVAHLQNKSLSVFLCALTRHAIDNNFGHETVSVFKICCAALTYTYYNRQQCDAMRKSVIQLSCAIYWLGERLQFATPDDNSSQAIAFRLARQLVFCSNQQCSVNAICSVLRISTPDIVLWERSLCAVASRDVLCYEDRQRVFIQCWKAMLASASPTTEEFKITEVIVESIEKLERMNLQSDAVTTIPKRHSNVRNLLLSAIVESMGLKTLADNGEIWMMELFSHICHTPHSSIAQIQLHCGIAILRKFTASIHCADNIEELYKTLLFLVKYRRDVMSHHDIIMIRRCISCRCDHGKIARKLIMACRCAELFSNASKDELVIMQNYVLDSAELLAWHILTKLPMSQSDSFSQPCDAIDVLSSLMIFLVSDSNWEELESWICLNIRGVDKEELRILAAIELTAISAFIPSREPAARSMLQLLLSKLRATKSQTDYEKIIGEYALRTYTKEIARILLNVFYNSQ